MRMPGNLEQGLFIWSLVYALGVGQWHWMPPRFGLYEAIHPVQAQWVLSWFLAILMPAAHHMALWQIDLATKARVVKGRERPPCRKQVSGCHQGFLAPPAADLGALHISYLHCFPNSKSPLWLAWLHFIHHPRGMLCQMLRTCENVYQISHWLYCVMWLCPKLILLLLLHWVH